VQFMLYNSLKTDTQSLAQPVHVAQRVNGVFARQVFIAAPIIALIHRSECIPWSVTSTDLRGTTKWLNWLKN
jgi:hypothetical protein